MSGGFFRGTSADQDTRFSNKQAKLLKSQKFAPEMEHLVDMTKVKMDVMKPWIATRVTELLGFEDEVLINFIYGLLDGKEVNGKQVQISLTGFMEKNTGKFMKELWSLLLSAQNNASGVPQQFLDAKEEETRKKKVEHDRIANEIHKKREKERLELEQEKIKKTDGDIDVSRTSNVPLEPSSKHQLRDANTRSVDEKETTERNGSRSRNRITKSPLSAEQSPPSPRGSPPGPVKSFSNSKSDSRGKNRSRSVSSSPKSRGRSISAERSYRSPRRRSITPRRRHSPRRYFSPPRYRSSHSRRRSISRSRRRSPSPLRRRRSPPRDISLSPVERRSRSPRPYGSRRRSPSPVRRRSPSPLRRRYRRSSSTPPRRYPSPTRHRSPVSSRRRSPSPPRRRSPSPQDWSSPSPVRRTSPAPSPVRRRSPKRQRRSLERSPRGRIRSRENYSPVRRAPPPGENVEKTLENRRRSESPVRRPRVSLRSPQRDLRVPSASPSPSKLSSASESPRAARKRSYKEDRRSSSAHESPVKQTREERTRGGNPSPVRKQRDKHRHDSPDTGVDKEEIDYSRSSRKSLHSPKADERKGLPEKGRHKDEYLHGRVATHRSGDTHNRHGGVELAKKDQETKSRRISDQEELPKTLEDTLPSEKHRNDSLPGERDEKTNALKASKKIENDDQIDSDDSDIQENNKTKHKDKRKHKREATSDDESYDSEIEDRKEAKKRRKEEKRSRKEERRRRREERRRKRKERHADKIKTKSVDMGSPPSDLDVEEAVSEQKRLEIELREKALESLRAKKGVTH